LPDDRRQGKVDRKTWRRLISPFSTEMADYLPAFRGCPVNLLHSQNKIFSRGPNHFFHTAIPSASRSQNGWEKCADRQTKALNLWLRSGGKPGLRSPGWINNARSNLEPFKLALVKTELEGRVDRWLFSRA
jgi:hypothetical protein